ncbi:hypothetical protein [Evansella tamaricis]|uniref:Uncharacterized protein n=1 Tax=Evansella tamaricis TaxID=2069301 RepID=A0ABS6JF65_9BACI|nr:hypothetical protein [Evansella tamaricis]MBU9712303.1 hypothetical protein [Evansella tamaricis]
MIEYSVDCSEPPGDKKTPCIRTKGVDMDGALVPMVKESVLKRKSTTKNNTANLLKK